MISRILDLPLGRQSFFLFGPRQVGKTTLVDAALEGGKYLGVDLLKSEVLLKYKTAPHLLRQEVDYRVKVRGECLVFVDEVQRCPELLSEAHYLLERYRGKVSFVLSGSSARKLKRASADMLGGRAWELRLHPFTHVELGSSFDLERALLTGTLPPVVGQSPSDAFQLLRAYCSTYLKQEVLDEALVRNIGAFTRFLDVAAEQSGAIVNYATISRDAGVSGRTIRAYYEILEDTLVAFKLEPYLKSARKRLVMHPKYFLFDLGVVNSLCGRTARESVRAPALRGALFEQFVILEAYRLLSYFRPEARLFHWRSAGGAEVDLVVEIGSRVLAIEIKSFREVRSRDLAGLASFREDHPDAAAVCVSTNDLPYMAGQVPVIPWQSLFGEEWLLRPSGA